MRKNMAAALDTFSLSGYMKMLSAEQKDEKTSFSKSVVAYLQGHKRTLAVLDLSNTKLQEIDLLPILQTIGQLTSLRVITFVGHGISDSSLNELAENIERTQVVTELRVASQLLTEAQKNTLYRLTQDGRKGLTLKDLQGNKCGPFYTNLEPYFASKAKENKEKIREITRLGLERYKEFHQ